VKRIRVRTREREELRDITDELRTALREAGPGTGVLHLWSMHTTCALTVNEGADPDVATDIVRSLRDLVPQNATFRHAEGNSDSHVKTSLLGPGLTLLVDSGELVLGTWQRVFLAEWDGPRERTIALIFQPA
jgi:secondary thiamine-phosphate synthase enzyme